MGRLTAQHMKDTPGPVLRYVPLAQAAMLLYVSQELSCSSIHELVFPHRPGPAVRDPRFGDDGGYIAF